MEPTAIFLPEKSHGQRSLAVYSRVRHDFVTKNNDSKRLMLGTPQEVELSFPMTFKEDPGSSSPNFQS